MSFFSGESVSYGWMCELAFLDLVHMMKFSFVIFQPCVACWCCESGEGQKQMICFFVVSYLVSNKFNKILLENTTCIQLSLL